MPDGLISARFEDLRAIAGNLQSTMAQHGQSLDDQRHEALRAEDFWQGQNNTDGYAALMCDQKLAGEDIERGQQKGVVTNGAADGFYDTVMKCSALFGKA
ncbi:hypothetical protein DMH01_01970 [Amycolatopsis sp. WAC 04182]|uniref:hypothetical protein n=1 Tax=Amycolatopsis sp. WAC 04182 TaxID=2203198 RepID=UPI000F78A2D4|nr:hypothetical protein [Amycolatopsis sp. WAC 04182]RSN65188.1 hypothetical protein DMH01_01970 [Amycolatopsis sp. WAC 04182]